MPGPALGPGDTAETTGLSSHGAYSPMGKTGNKQIIPYKIGHVKHVGLGAAGRLKG